MRIVRRGFTPMDLKILIASRTTDAPSALSAAPVPECHESRCAADHDNFVFQVGAGNFRDDVISVLIVGQKFRLNIDAEA